MVQIASVDPIECFFLLKPSLLFHPVSAGAEPVEVVPVFGAGPSERATAEPGLRPTDSQPRSYRP